MGVLSDAGGMRGRLGSAGGGRRLGLRRVVSGSSIDERRGSGGSSELRRR